MMERKVEWEVGGFCFGSEKDAELAKMEQDKIGFMEKRMQYDKPQTVLAVYNKAIENRIFQTPVGFQYLQKIYDFLEQEGLQEEAKSIPLYQSYTFNPYEEMKARMPRRRIQASEYRQLRSRLRKSVILNIFLVILVAAMFVITLTADQPNILNYKRTLLNQYASWEQELTEREAAVREKEQALLEKK